MECELFPDHYCSGRKYNGLIFEHNPSKPTVGEIRLVTYADSYSAYTGLRWLAARQDFTTSNLVQK